jgi:FkbM family methyltransferase
LRKNLQAFPGSESVPAGLGAKAGTLEFFHGDESCVGSFVPEYTRQHPGNCLREQIATTQVRVMTGDAALSHLGTIDVMKLDVEGFEGEVLRGMSALLAAGAIKQIFFEFCPLAQSWAHNQPEDIIHLLNQSGYAVYEIEGESEGALVSGRTVTALIQRLGDRGYTMLRATRQPVPNNNEQHTACVPVAD